MVFFVVLNIVGIRWLARANNALTSWKVAVPILTIIVLLVSQFHGSNFSAGGGFFVHGAAVKSILIAIPTGGIVFSLLGFEQAVQLGGEARNPSKDLPRAVIISILLGGAIYVLVQVAFIGALEPRLLTQAKTWSGLVPGTNSPALAALNAAPFYQVATLASIGWLATILRIDAIVSPGGTGLIYTTSSSRISFGLSKNGYIPEAFEKNNARTKVPVFSIIIAAIIGLLFLLPFPSWSKLVGVVTSASVMMYAGAPLSLGALRLQKPELPRPYRIPGGQVMAAIGFILASLIVYWAGWGTYSTLMIALLIGYALMLASAAFHLNPHQPKLDWGAAWWIFPYLIGMGILSYFGTFGQGGMLDGVGVFKNVLVGGNNDLGLYGGLIAVAAWGLIIYMIAIRQRLPPAMVDEYVREVYPPPVAE
jgi:amino acid transporter